MRLLLRDERSKEKRQNASTSIASERQGSKNNQVKLLGISQEGFSALRE